MTAKRPGRNDPCPCGSGKKYKYCCLRKDRKRRPVHAPSSAFRQDQGDTIQQRLDQMRYRAQMTLPHATPDQAQELQQLLNQAEEIAAYEAMRDKIEAATQALETHRAEFEALMQNGIAAMDHAHRLFSEERFAPIRYTAADVHRAFEVVGYPKRYREELQEEDIETLVAAILHLADDKEYRFHLARRLMMMVPDYVTAGRFLDAWLIQHSAFLMVEKPDESNPFLFEMFHHGFIEWASQVEDQQEDLLHEFGIDRSVVAGMSADEIEAWLRAQMADPGKKAQLEAYFTAHPILSDQAEAELRDLERGTFLLLERDDADCLYLSPEEVDPWVPAAMERLAPIEASARQAAERGEWDDPDILQAMANTLIEVAREMVPAVFTPERLDRLVADLKYYRRDLLEAGEKEATMYAHAASAMLEREEAPTENPLLIAICLASLRLMLITLAEEARARTEGRTNTEKTES